MAEIADISRRVEEALAVIDKKIEGMLKRSELDRAKDIAKYKQESANMNIEEKERAMANLRKELRRIDSVCGKNIAIQERKRYGIIGTARSDIAKARARVEEELTHIVRKNQSYKEDKAAAEKEIADAQKKFALVGEEVVRSTKKRCKYDQLDTASQREVAGMKQKKVRYDKEYAKLKSPLREFSITPPKRSDSCQTEDTSGRNSNGPLRLGSILPRSPLLFDSDDESDDECHFF